MRICCLADLHGYLPREIPDCDLLLLAGDLVSVHSRKVELSSIWMRQTLKPWVDRLAQRMKVIAVAGNHDFIFQDAPELVPAMDWTYLQDSGTEFRELKIYGSPHQPRFFDWAFNLDEHELAERWALIPDDTDILLLHGPPHGYADSSPHGDVHTGSPSLLRRITEIQPKLAVCGHIHTGYGRYQIGTTLLVSASLVDDRYQPINEPIVVEIGA